MEVPKRHFEQELEQLMSKLQIMSRLVESAVFRSITAAQRRFEQASEPPAIRPNCVTLPPDTTVR